MDTKDNKKIGILPIAVAEGSSTLVSLGALWLMEKLDKPLDPLQHYLTRTLVYPQMAKGKPLPENPEIDLTYQKAFERASLIIKGTGMVGVGFASHIPIQLALEGKSDAKSLGVAVVGKGVGIGVSLGSIMLLNKFAPDVMPAIQNAIYPIIEPLLPKNSKDRKSAEEVAKLIILDVPSSIIAGFINYAVAHKIR